MKTFKYFRYDDDF